MRTSGFSLMADGRGLGCLGAFVLKPMTAMLDLRLEGVEAVIDKYDIFAERKDQDHITLKGFTHYLLSQETAHHLLHVV